MLIWAAKPHFFLPSRPELAIHPGIDPGLAKRLGFPASSRFHALVSPTVRRSDYALENGDLRLVFD